MSNRIYRSPLFQTIKEYLLKSSHDKKIIYLFVPYIKTIILKQLLEGITSKVIIITTWNTADLLAGSSELELYPFCKKYNITLYVNNQIHLKVYSSALDNMIVSSANVSERGLLPEGNFECATFVDKISAEDRLYFENIRKNARLVNDIMFEQLSKWYEKQIKRSYEKNIFDEIIDPPSERDFLISALPMTRDIEILEMGYSRINQGMKPSEDDEISNCIFHDLANYNIELGLRNVEFRKKLKLEFFSHPFIQRIDEFIAPESYFGSIKEWIQRNCTDVPVPSRRELTGNVQVLLEWFEKLGGGKYVIDIPGAHSQRIRNVTP